MSSKNAICTWDFTLSKAHINDRISLIKKLDDKCKKWAFQLETGEKTGYEHYQGRVSLKLKVRNIMKIFDVFKFHWSITSNENKDNNFYVIKSDTRTDGPWTDKMDLVPHYIPKQIRAIKELYPFQKKIIKILEIWDTRHINVLVDDVGNIGKSIIKTYCGVHKIACIIPFCNDYKDVLRSVMDRPKRGAYIIDMPRCINKERLYQLYSAIETIKDGYAYDDRYKFREEYFDCPNIFIFTNSTPDKTLLTPDRWKIWKVFSKTLIEMKVNF